MVAAYCHDPCDHGRGSACCDGGGAVAGASARQNELQVAAVSTHIHNSAVDHYSTEASCHDHDRRIDASFDAVAMA